MTIKELILELKRYDSHNEIVLWPNSDEQHVEQIEKVIFVNELNRVVIQSYID